MNHVTRILVIEDEPGIALALYKALREAAYHVDTAKTGTSGLRKAAAKKFDIILLDLGLPDMSGLTICRQLRDEGLKAPIIILTAESSVRTKVSLFDAGANDYVTKPFSVEELQARIRACLRQVPKEPLQPRLVVGELTLNSANRTVERGGLAIPLRRKEFSILEYMMQHAGTAVTRASLLQYAWDSNEEGWTNTIDVHIKHLRDKVDRPFAINLIKTVHGVGYKLDVSNTVAKIP
ncbi:MAG: two component transcriptional regulator, winged helix family [Candidatus Saccharibacteria bacterium]|nr:two component transcriptional regulator, winged helix family [Candidatus Saccharibacteria bacterium]